MRKKLYKKERGPRLATCPAGEDLLAAYKETAHPDSLPPPEIAETAARRYLRERVFGHDGFSIVVAESI